MKIRPTRVVDALDAAACLVAVAFGVLRGQPPVAAAVVLVVSVARLRCVIEATPQGLVVRNRWSTRRVAWTDVWGFRVQHRGLEAGVLLVLPLGQVLRLDATGRLRFFPPARAALDRDVRRLDEWQRRFAPPTERRG